MAEVIVNVKADTGQATQQVDDLNNSLNQTANSAEDASEKIDVAEGRIKALGGAINIVGGSVEVLAGGLALSGALTEEQAERFEAAAVGAIAFADGTKRVFEGVKELKEGIQLLGGAQKIATAATKAFGVATKIALGPIGLAIAAIGAITAAIVLLKDKFEAVNKVATFFGNIFQKVAEFVGLAASEEEKFRDAQAEASKESEFQLKLLQAQGASTEELVEAERKLLTQRLNSFKEGTEEYKAAQQELQLFEARTAKARQDAIDKENEERRKKRQEEREKRKAEEEKAAEEAAKEAEAAAKKAAEDEAKRQEAILNVIKSYAEQERDIAAQTELDKLNLAEQRALDELDSLGATEEEKNAIIEFYARRRTELEKKEGEEQLKNEQLIAEAKLAAQLELAAGIAGALGALSGLLKEGTAAAKAAALAEIAIGTGVGFVQALDIAQKTAKGTGPAAAFAFPIFYATQIAAVLNAVGKAKSILTQVPGGGNAPTPTAPQTPRASIGGFGTPVTGGSFVGGTEAPAVRAYVVTGDVTNGQQAEGQIKRRRSLGG